ncbi:unnamed protein product [Echinostoma caproni]|uniref:CCHC-type domain-containing protein n=1 Tax=Echinostoma caproni TaxID=27848 RepID=A0A183BC43_9TREM|nr:unnamed protein product [Echinostoma caproni]
MFLEVFEDVAKLAGIRTDRGKLTALRVLLKGRARAVLDAARRNPEKMEWAAANDALIAGFDTPADRQEALHHFMTVQLEVGVDPLSHAVALRWLLDHALPTLDENARSELLLDHFTESLPEDIREKAKLINVARTMDVVTLAEVVRQFTGQEIAAVQMQEFHKDEPPEDVKATVDRLTDEVAALKSNFGRKKNTNACFHCGRRGHWRRNCPERYNKFSSNTRLIPYTRFLSNKAITGAVDRGAVRASLEIDQIG